MLAAHPCLGATRASPDVFTSASPIIEQVLSRADTNPDATRPEGSDAGTGQLREAWLFSPSGPDPGLRAATGIVFCI